MSPMWFWAQLKVQPVKWMLMASLKSPESWRYLESSSECSLVAVAEYEHPELPVHATMLPAILDVMVSEFCWRDSMT